METGTNKGTGREGRRIQEGREYGRQEEDRHLVHIRKARHRDDRGNRGTGNSERSREGDGWIKVERDR